MKTLLVSLLLLSMVLVVPGSMIHVQAGSYPLDDPPTTTYLINQTTTQTILSQTTQTVLTQVTTTETQTSLSTTVFAVPVYTTFTTVTNQSTLTGTQTVTSTHTAISNQTETQTQVVTTTLTSTGQTTGTTGSSGYSIVFSNPYWECDYTNYAVFSGPISSNGLTLEFIAYNPNTGQQVTMFTKTETLYSSPINFYIYSSDWQSSPTSTYTDLIVDVQNSYTGQTTQIYGPSNVLTGCSGGFTTVTPTSTTSSYTVTVNQEVVSTVSTSSTTTVAALGTTTLNQTLTKYNATVTSASVATVYGTLTQSVTVTNTTTVPPPPPPNPYWWVLPTAAVGILAVVGLFFADSQGWLPFEMPEIPNPFHREPGEQKPKRKRKNQEEEIDEETQEPEA